MGLKDANGIYKQIHNDPICEKTNHSCWVTYGGLSKAWAIWYCVGPHGYWEGWCIGRQSSLGTYWGGIFYSETTAHAQSICPSTINMDWDYTTANNVSGSLTHVKLIDAEDWKWNKGKGLF